MSQPHPSSMGATESLCESIKLTSNDYLKFFFESVNKHDINKDNKVSFNEPHWYASAQLEPHNISYSDTDAIVDEYFKKSPNALATSINLAELKQLNKWLTPEESYALNKLVDKLNDDLQIELTTHIAKHQAAVNILKDKTELTSNERNQLVALDYPLNLVILGRRAIYRKNTLDMTKDLLHCENRIISEFVNDKKYTH